MYIYYISVCVYSNAPSLLLNLGAEAAVPVRPGAAALTTVGTHYGGAIFFCAISWLEMNKEPGMTGTIR